MDTAPSDMEMGLWTESQWLTDRDQSQSYSQLVGKDIRNVLFNDALNTFFFTVIWHQTYGKGPFR